MRSARTAGKPDQTRDEPVVGPVVLSDELSVDGEAAEVVEQSLEGFAVLPERITAVLGDDLGRDQRAQPLAHLCVERLGDGGLERGLRIDRHQRIQYP